MTDENKKRAYQEHTSTDDYTPVYEVEDHDSQIEPASNQVEVNESSTEDSSIDEPTNLSNSEKNDKVPELRNYDSNSILSLEKSEKADDNNEGSQLTTSQI